MRITGRQLKRSLGGGDRFGTWEEAGESGMSPDAARDSEEHRQDLDLHGTARGVSCFAHDLAQDDQKQV